MIETPSGPLYSLEVGSGDHIAVVLHGGPAASHDYLRPQMDALGEPGKRRLLYYDQRGGGRSLQPGQVPVGVEGHVRDVESVRLAIAEERITLVGYSWGGLLALHYAVAHPDRIARLVLVSTAPASAAERVIMQQRLAAAAQGPEVEALRRELDPKDRGHRFALAVAGYFVKPRQALELTPFLIRQAAADAVIRSLEGYDLHPELARLSIPTLVVHGEEDPVPLSGARRIADDLKAELVSIPGCAHVPYIEAPEVLFAAVRRFLG